MRYRANYAISLVAVLALMPQLSSQAHCAPKSQIEIRWKTGIILSGTFYLSALVDRKTKTFGWTEAVWASPPIFTGFEIRRLGSKYHFTGGNLHEEVVWFQIDGKTLEGNPCDPPGHACITRIQVIDNDTFTIRINDKEENTYYKVDGMKQIFPDEEETKVLGR